MNGPITTGIALANPNNSPATVNFYFSDASGDSRLGSVTIPANGQLSKFLNQEPYNGATGFEGIFSFTSDFPVGIMALRGLTNERGDFLTSTLPIIDTGGNRNSGTTLAHFADGQGWSTEVVLANTTDKSMMGDVQFSNELGTFSYSIPPHGTQKFGTPGSSAVKTSGSVRILSSNGAASPDAFALLSYKPEGITVTQTAVSPIVGRSFHMFAESSGTSGQPGNIQSGLAIANISSSPVTVMFELTRLDGSPIAVTTSLTVPASGHVAKFLDEIFPNLPNPFQGLVRFATTSSEISVTGLRSHYNERGDLLVMTTQPENDAVDALVSVMVVPQFAIGGESPSQMILFSKSGRHSSGTVRFVGQAGEVVPLN
jgi:hypothetical protein